MHTISVINHCALFFIPFFSCVNATGGSVEELKSCSKYDFEEKLLEKLVRMEHALELNEENMKILEKKIDEKMKMFAENIKENLKRLDKDAEQREKIFQQKLKDMSDKLRRDDSTFLNIAENFTTVSETIYRNIWERYIHLPKDGFTACGGRRLSSNIIDFQTTKTDYGIDMGSYYRSGVFTAGYGGFYFVTTNILSSGNKHGFHINHNDVQVSSGYAHWGGSSNGYHTASASAFVRLDKGDTVFIKATGSIDVDHSSCLTIVKI